MLYELTQLLQHFDATEPFTALIVAVCAAFIAYALAEFFS